LNQCGKISPAGGCGVAGCGVKIPRPGRGGAKRRGGVVLVTPETKKNKRKETMKKILLLLCLMIPTINIANAATMCVKNDTISVVLDPAIGNTTNSTYSYNTAASTWWTAFPYGTIHGISACLSSKYGQSMGGYVSQLSDTNPNTNESARVVGGETNGLHCWCKMTHPAVSRWVFAYSYSSLAGCAGDCASNCGIYARSRSALRAGLFGSVAQ